MMDTRWRVHTVPATSIVGGQLTGKILRPDGSTLVLDTVACRVRSR